MLARQEEAGMSKLRVAADRLRLTREWAMEGEALDDATCVAGVAMDVSTAIAEPEERQRELRAVEDRFWDAFMAAAQPDVPARITPRIDVEGMERAEMEEPVNKRQENRRKVMTQTEAAVLRPQAERLVRVGVSRAEVGRKLGIHPMTLEADKVRELTDAAGRRFDAAVEHEADQAAARAYTRQQVEARANEPDPWDADAWTLEGMALGPPEELVPAVAADPDFRAYASAC
jgi:hypothetical protein